MAWSFKIARVAGSDIRIHVTFFLLLIWIGLIQADQGAEAALEGVVFVIAIFTCVVLHELGHALAARRYGIRTPDITLLPIGGLARLERIPENPREEIVVALAGPAVNVVIAGALILLLGAQPELGTLGTLEEAPDSGGARQGTFVERLAAVNVILAVFNMVPALPMDGGRVLRAVLALSQGRVRATQTAAKIGQGIAFLFGFMGLFGNPLLIFIAIFVYLAAAAEAESASLQDVAKSLKVCDAMITQFEALDTQATMAEAADALIRTTQQEFPVVDGAGHFRGLLTRAAMVKAMEESGPHSPVVKAMINLPERLVSEPLAPSLEIIQAGGAPAFAVNDKAGRFIGYVTRENIAELMLIHAARHH
ncbi:MAG: site-2 protease family protein [Pseudomonadota bacterium]